MAVNPAALSNLAVRLMRMSDEEMREYQRARGDFQFFADVRHLGAAVLRIEHGRHSLAAKYGMQRPVARRL